MYYFDILRVAHFWASDSVPSTSSFGVSGAASTAPYKPAALSASRNCLRAFDSEMQKPFETGRSGKSGFSTADASPPSAVDDSRHLSSLTISLGQKRRDSISAKSPSGFEV